MKKLTKILGAALLIGGMVFGSSIKNIETTNYGTLITFKNDTGYFMER